MVIFLMSTCNVLPQRFPRIYNKADNSQRAEFARLAHDDMKDLASRIYGSLENGMLPPFISVDEPNNERKGLVALLPIMRMQDDICLFSPPDLSIR